MVLLNRIALYLEVFLLFTLIDINRLNITSQTHLGMMEPS